ncbi:MAG: DUF3488 and transglutaminase-like domain-containing protein [Sedimenticola sp.]|nr:DUF3488 and transglutaminase-like domain-containing protein [Sedimenticola sp.]
MNSTTQLSRPLLYSLTLITALVVAPHFQRLNAVIILAFLAVLGLRWGTLYFSGWKPGKLVLFTITLMAAILIFTTYPLLMGLEAKVALLSLMLGLKLMECRSQRDLIVVLFLGYFTLITHFLFDQEMLLVGYVFIMVITLTALLVEASRTSPSEGWHFKSLRYSGAMIVQAIPIMLLLFFLFPRISGPLWNLGVDNSTGRTGLSDSITPGDISNLIRSRAVAFRVDFDETAPPPQQRYWRGPVLWNTDGYRWTRTRYLQTEPVSYRSDAPPISYQVTLEPSPNDWLYALDLPETLPSEATLLPDFQIKAKNIRNRRHRYAVTSRLSYHTGSLNERERGLGLQLPDNITPRMRDLVRQWRSQNTSDLALVNQSLRYFRSEPYYYTLTPPLLGNNPVDQFLFDSRRGFCEHYATSFTSLMRIAGIPARVVTGYQGGELNPLGNYLIVRQSDAHAWSEVWLEESGWTRVDPTAAVAPERIEQTFDFDLEENSILGIPVIFSTGNSGLLKDLTHQFRLGIDAANASWHRWVLGYSKEQQQKLMQQLGLGNLNAMKLAIAMILAIAVMILLLLYLLRLRSEVKPDPVLKDYLTFCRRLSGKGIQRFPHEGPDDYSHRIIRKRPDLRQSVNAITQHYIRLRYGQSDSPQLRRTFHRLVRQFRA